ncbi:hypothetical protein AAGV28_11385 [Flavobacterium sp. FZUC8N2.13]|uniref:Uncharacterized protein n=1 Tax=Flavobacterium zubiriense TaxID=3138075 RepID=A0ABV4TDB9_9FLAO
MKKLFQFLFVFYSSILLSQTVLTSHPIDFKKSNENKAKLNIEKLRTLDEVLLSATSDFKNSKENNQILNIENENTHEVFVFIKDSEKITILKYNRALFLNSEYVFPLQNLEDVQLTGCSFSKNGKLNLYLSPILPGNKAPLAFILTLKFDLENKTHTLYSTKLPPTEVVVTTFQMNNSFHILAQHRIMQTLIVYSFEEPKVAKKVFDLSSFTFQDKNGKMQNFNSLTNAYPIEKMDVNDYNLLDKTAQKSKVYIQNNHIVLTLDYSPKNTQAFDLNLENGYLSEKNFPQSVLQDAKKKSNSFYHRGKLYQINVSESELSLDIKDFNSGETLKKTRVLNESDQEFKNIPLFIQKDSRKPKDIKKPKQFLQHLNDLDVGLTVYNTKRKTYISIGGIPMAENKENLFQANASYNSFLYDEFSDIDFAPIYHFKYAYFESILDQNLELVAREETPLAIDKLHYFVNTTKKTTLTSVLKYKDYYILGYYDKKSKQYIMRKFTDGFN